MGDTAFFVFYFYIARLEKTYAVRRARINWF